MSIRAALLAALCLSAAACTPSTPNLSGAFSSLRSEDPPARTCRNVASDVVALSGRASQAAGIPVREPRIGEAGVTEVAWPSPKADPGAPEPDPALGQAMARLQAEAEMSGCAIAFRESLPPSAAEVAAAAATAQPVAVDTAARPGSSRSAWNAPVTPVAPTAPAARVAAAGRPNAPGPAPQGVQGGSVPAQGVAPRAVPKPAPKPVAQAAPEPEASPQPVAVPAQALVIVPAAKPAARPEPVEQSPRQAVRSIPITQAPAQSSAQ